MSATPKIVSLVHYPMKGMNGIDAPKADLTPGEGMPFDRIYAIENGGHAFDTLSPKWFPKVHFLQLMRNERLASLHLAFDEDSHTLTLFRDGRQVARGALKTRLGRQMIEQFLAAYMKDDLKGPPRIVHADGDQFTDIAAKALHVVNLETVRDVSRVTGVDLAPARFRANLYFEGLPAWEERHWVGKTLTCGGAQLEVFAETARCEATSVDPATAQRGISIPAALQGTWGHKNLGLYAKVTRGGAVGVGDVLTVA
ncbi:MOSC domain-containing protein [Rhodomicrobium lacus]|uniref:MOSC domain-containing protein n=1 Tax=Rhodomicrobium lacus TaxID=2498452 RepID=UPI000F8E7B44|nr:MOSC domain-containing protein [Rhodomicrobium lacus]